MAGIYLHIPFCSKACHYCDFHFSTSLKHRGEVLEAMCREIKLRKDYLKGETVNTLYLGGGTPSLLESEELNRLFEAIASVHSLSSDCEITLEANPDDLTPAKVTALKDAKVNRVSVGVQSFFDEDLRWMNRSHKGTEALQSIHRLQDAGLENLTIDLVYGYELLSDDKWASNLETFLELGIPHLSCYNLTVEEGTALAAFISKGKQAPLSDEQGERQFLLLMDRMEKEGFLHYEISNFCLPGHYSHHNTAYWQEKKYLGIGPSAHSFNGTSRSWNVNNNHRYCEGIRRGTPFYEEELLTKTNRINERIMTGLRTMWGLELESILMEFGPDTFSALQQAATNFIDAGWLEAVSGTYRLTKSGKLYADRIAADLFFMNESVE